MRSCGSSVLSHKALAVSNHCAEATVWSQLTSVWFNSLYMHRVHTPELNYQYCVYHSIMPGWHPGQTIQQWPSVIRDRGYKSGTVPEIPGQLEPMLVNTQDEGNPKEMQVLASYYTIIQATTTLSTKKSPLSNTITTYLEFSKQYTTAMAKS